MTLFLAPEAPSLNERSTEICPCQIQSEETQGIINQMLETANGQKETILVGLAAPQIGIQKRIILVDLAATGVFTEGSQPPTPNLQVYVNPEIIWKSEEMNVWREGCFSTSRICGIVPRFSKIIIRAYDRSGDITIREFSGYTARIFQHEIDHLDGIRFPDRIANDFDLHWVELEELPDYRIHWATWQKKTPREKWVQMKHRSD